MDDAESARKVPREDTHRPAKKVWATPTIEEAEATEITEAKSAANVETPFSKAGS